MHSDLYLVELGLGIEESSSVAGGTGFRSEATETMMMSRALAGWFRFS